MFKLSREFLRSSQGSLPTAVALAALPIMLTAGVAIDYGRMTAMKTATQAALDTAVLAAASTKDINTAQAKKIFARNAPSPHDVAVSSLSFKKGGGGTVTGTATVTMPLGLMSLAGKSTQSITVTSKAVGAPQLKMKDVTFQITHAQGVFDKDFYFFSKDAQGKIIKEELVLSYDYIWYNQAFARVVYTPPLNSTKTLSTGDYFSSGVKMVVYRDDSGRGQRVNPKSFYSDDPKSNTWIHKDGDCVKTGFETQHWEDGGDANFMDFQYNVTCTTEETDRRSARLVK